MSPLIPLFRPSLATQVSALADVGSPPSRSGWRRRRSLRSGRRGGPFYSITMLPPVWQKLSLLNPSVYLISGFRWSFFDKSEMHIGISFAMTLSFFVIALTVATWIMRTGWPLKA